MKSYVGMTVCERCGQPNGVIIDRRLKDTFNTAESYASGLCKECEEEVKLFKELVAAGGIYFRCTMCKSEGVIKLSDTSRPLIERVREMTYGRDDSEWMSKPAGIELDECRQHKGEQE